MALSRRGTHAALQESWPWGEEGEVGGERGRGGKLQWFERVRNRLKQGREDGEGMTVWNAQLRGEPGGVDTRRASVWDPRAWPGSPQALGHFGQVQSTDGLGGRTPGSNLDTTQLWGLPRAGMREDSALGKLGVGRKLGRGLSEHLMTHPLPASQPSGISAPLL